MIVGVPRERHHHEHRVGLTPFAAARIIQQGHTVLVEKAAGEMAHFLDRDYQAVGAQTVFSAEEAYRRADIVCWIGQLSGDELELVEPESILCSFQHLAVAPLENVERLMELRATLIGYEIIRDEERHLPVLTPLSEMAGQMAVQIAAHYLQNESGGRGILMGVVPGVPPPTVLVLGAGTAGHAAARYAMASGAHVIVLDNDLAKLRSLHHESPGVVTVLAGLGHLGRYTALADAVIGAVLIPGGRAPIVVSEDMVRSMKRGSVIVDLSIDQGGCVETGRPTTLDTPTFVVHGVVHYCVPNMTANIARTASRALANAALPYLLELVVKGVDGALASDPGLAEGVYLYEGHLVNERAAGTLGLPVSSLREVMGEGERS
ncbi:MAG: alanine dehydrogenase [Candidatus Krumholzibacteriia bacterium]